MSVLHEVLKNLTTYLEGVKAWDWKVIILCAFTACTFWLFNALNNDHTTNLRVPISIVYDRSNIVTVTSPPNSLMVNVSGYGWNLLRKTLVSDRTPLYFKLEDPTAANFITTKSLQPLLAEKLSDLRINFIVGDSLFFRFDTLAYKDVKLKLEENSFSLARNHYRSTPVLIVPEFIRVSGASSLIREYPDTLFLQLNEENISKAFFEKIKVNFPYPGQVMADIDQVEVKFDVAPLVEKAIKVPVRLINAPLSDQLSVFPAEANVLLFMAEGSDISQTDSLELWVDYQDYSVTDTLIRPRLNTIPSGVKNFSVSPEFFSVRFQDE